MTTNETPRPRPPLTAKQRQISAIAMQLMEEGTDRAEALRAATWAVEHASRSTPDRVARTVYGNV